ncbi:MAG: TIGR04219 family outer membrane beta-barrel protein [Desulfobacteraceae bacterium]|nr:TIGR04219 family outer membrane beta-barrel protein [Desulfobacteraceae bacterium]
MKLKSAVLVFVFLFIPLQSFCLPLIDAEIAAGGWFCSPDGFAGYKGDDLYLERDLGYEDQTELTGRIRLELPLLLPNITFMTTNLSFDGDNTTGRSFDFGNTSFNGDDKISSELKLNHHDFAVSFSLPLLNLATLGKLQADLGVNLRLIDIEASMEQTTENSGLKRESKSLDVPIPMGFAYLRLEPVSGIGLEAEGRMLSIGGNSVTSLIGRIRYHVLGPLFIAGGYRVEKIDVDEEGIRIDTDFKGPFFEGGFKF